MYPIASRTAGWLLGLLAVAGVCAGCGGGPPTSAYEQGILAHRQAKDLIFFDPAQSVLDQAERTRFVGLRYFPVDSTFRFVVPLVPEAEPETVWIPVQDSPPSPYQRIGVVALPWQGKVHPLAVFQGPKMAEDQGWIPFTDATSGRDAYGGGRYLDVTLRQDGMVIVDFNLAYNPYCDYNIAYKCALPPAENRLPFAVEAGEKRSLLLTSASL